MYLHVASIRSCFSGNQAETSNFVRKKSEIFNDNEQKGMEGQKGTGRILSWIHQYVVII